MNITSIIESFRPNASLHSVAIIFGLTTAIVVSEVSLFLGYVRYAIWSYFALLFILTVAPLLLERETPLFHAFALIPIFRLVNLTMPVFVELTLLWLPFIYGPFILVFVYIGWQTSTNESEPSPTDRSDVVSPGQEVSDSLTRKTEDIGYLLPWWLGGNQGGKLRWLSHRTRQFLTPPDKDLTLSRSVLYWVTRGFLVVLLPFVTIIGLALIFTLAIYLAEVKYSIISPTPLIPSLNFYQILVLTVIMVGFVGLIEELLFRGVLQKMLEKRLGILLGLLLTSGIFGIMYSTYGSLTAIVLASGIGLLLGIIYDVTDSLVLVSIIHGVMNVFLFGVIPLIGVSPIELLQTIIVQGLQRTGIKWMIDALPLLRFWILVSSF